MTKIKSVASGPNENPEAIEQKVIGLTGRQFGRFDLSPSDLDEVVHDVKRREARAGDSVPTETELNLVGDEAATINNAGPERQLRYLHKAIGFEATLDLIGETLELESPSYIVVYGKTEGATVFDLESFVQWASGKESGGEGSSLITTESWQRATQKLWEEGHKLHIV